MGSSVAACMRSGTSHLICHMASLLALEEEGRTSRRGKKAKRGVSQTEHSKLQHPNDLFLLSSVFPQDAASLTGKAKEGTSQPKKLCANTFSYWTQRLGLGLTQGTGKVNRQQAIA